MDQETIAYVICEICSDEYDPDEGRDCTACMRVGCPECIPNGRYTRCVECDFNEEEMYAAD